MRREVFLHPGEFYFADGPARIQTILGSCVAFTMRDPISGRAAMCHCLLPQMPKGEGNVDGKTEKFRYVDTSFEGMLHEFRIRGVPAERLEIKLFGGANVIKAMSKTTAIGSLNWQQAKRSLQKLSLALSAHDVGGAAGRRLVFETVSGEVLVKRLRTIPEAKTARDRGAWHAQKA